MQDATFQLQKEVLLPPGHISVLTLPRFYAAPQAQEGRAVSHEMSSPTEGSKRDTAQGLRASSRTKEESETWNTFDVMKGLDTGQRAFLVRGTAVVPI